MPEKETIDRAREDAREGKSPSTQAGEFVREEMHHVREGKHGAALHQAGHCDRPLKSPTRRGRTAGAEQRESLGTRREAGYARFV